MYYYLVYSSKATPLFLKGDLDRILQHSRIHNTKKNITGMLLYDNGKFIQVLEGDEKTISELYQTISADDRHSHIQKIIEGYTEQRQFADWAMAYREISDAEYDAVEGELSLSRGKILKNTTPDIAAPIAILLKRFLPA